MTGLLIFLVFSWFENMGLGNDRVTHDRSNLTQRRNNNLNSGNVELEMPLHYGHFPVYPQYGYFLCPQYG